MLASVSASAATEVLVATEAGWGWASLSRSGQTSAARHLDSSHIELETKVKQRFAKVSIVSYS